MALVEPVVGHLLSRYEETVRDGLGKIETNSKNDPLFATSIMEHPQAIEALKRLLKNPIYTAAIMDTCCSLVLSCNNASRTRTRFLCEFFQSDSLVVLKNSLNTVRDDSIATVIAALKLLTLGAEYVPKVVVSRFTNLVPLNYSCFSLQLTYAQRRIRTVRLQFLIQLVKSRFVSNDLAAKIMVVHGYFTLLLEDAAALLQDGTESGFELANEVLHIFEVEFICAKSIPIEVKKSVLLGQKNILRLLSKALEFPAVCDSVARVLCRIIVEMQESPSDYATSHVDASEGMPNFVLFTLLRALRPKNSPVASRLVIFLLNKSSDLIRPYFSRISGHLIEETSSSTRLVAPSTARMATLNVITRIFQLPLPYRLEMKQVKLEKVPAKATKFYTMSVKNVVEEICPSWLAEFIHKQVNNSTNLLQLVFAMQATQAALDRAKRVLQIVSEIQEDLATQAKKMRPVSVKGEDNGENARYNEDELRILTPSLNHEGFDQDDWSLFNAELRAELQKHMPRSQEFWHRLTQQIFPKMEEMFKKSAGANTVSISASDQNARDKIWFVYERLLVLIDSYNDVFLIRTPMVSAAPSVLPTFRSREKAITNVLLEGRDILFLSSPAVISTLSSLLVTNLANRVSVVKMHHINMGKGAIKEWPLLLSILLWAVHQRKQLPMLNLDHLIESPSTKEGAKKTDATQVQAQNGEKDRVEAILWVVRLLQNVIRSVTVSCNAEWGEALLWVMCLSEEVLPCFLHLLNNLYTRSVSKNADKVAEELFEHEEKQGVLVTASASFLAKAEEKMSGAKQENSTPQKDKMKGDNNQVDFWNEDLVANISNFKKIVNHVKKSWASREDVTHKVEKYYSSLREGGNGVRASDEIREQKAPTVDAFQDLSLLIPPQEQLLNFFSALRSPVQPVTEEETIIQEKVLNAPFVEAKKSEKTLLETFFRKITVEQWLSMPSLCWETSGRLLKELDAHQKSRAAVEEDNETLEITKEKLSNLCEDLLSTFGKEKSQIISKYTSFKTEFSFGLMVCILVNLRVLLTLRPTGYRDGTQAHEAVIAPITDMLLNLYCGSLSVRGRLIYACLLTIHYLENLPEASKNSKSQADRSSIPIDDEEGETSDVDSSDSSNEDDEPDRVEKTGGRLVFTGAKVPSPLRKCRFLIRQHVPSVDNVPEADILSFLIEGWSESDKIEFALKCPARLHNSILCHSKNASWDLLRSVFPEVSVEADARVIDFAANTASNLVDPRYILPLLQTAVSLPESVRRMNWTISCLPLLIRALSFTNSTLREYAAAILANSYIPKGPGMVVSTFARLKLWQIALRQKRKSKDTKKKNRGEAISPKKQLIEDRKNSSTENLVPRLPTPLAAFLILALSPLNHYRDILHNHIIHFLIEPFAAFSEAVPFSQWLFSFPMECVSVPLMLHKQQELVKHTIGAAQSTAKRNTEDLKRNIPPHLEFVASLIEHACETNGDAIALIKTNCLQGVMLLVNLLTSSTELRVKMVKVLHVLCRSSHDVAQQLALEGGVLLWAVNFAEQLYREFGSSSIFLYGETLFVEVLKLVKRLSAVITTSEKRSTSFPSRRRYVSTPFVSQMHTQMLLLKSQLIAIHVTAKSTLSLLDEIINLFEQYENETGRKEERRHAAHDQPSVKRARPSQHEETLEKNVKTKKFDQSEPKKKEKMK